MKFLRKFQMRKLTPTKTLICLLVFALSFSLIIRSLLSQLSTENCPKAETCNCENRLRTPSPDWNADQRIHRLCLIIPFRNRFEELLVFAPYMDAYLRRQKRVGDFRMLVMNQIDMYRFNRAALINAGYFEAQSLGCDYLGMHDVDLLPLNDQLDYGYPASGPYHVASPAYHPRYHYKDYVGGILLLTLNQYRSLNGMSNKYWGWGLEDDEFFLRMRDANYTIVRPTNLNTNSSTTFRHVHSEARPRDTVQIGDQRREAKKRDRKTGLNTSKYEVVDRTALTIDNVSLSVINIKLFCDVVATPWCKSK